MTTKAKADPGATQCECFHWSYEGLGTGCDGRPTMNTFAPGHDAKLKSLLIHFGSNGGIVHRGSEEMKVLVAADRFGFAHQVAAGIQKQADREMAKQVRKAAKAKRQADKLDGLPNTTAASGAKVTQFPVAVKIGRWQYKTKRPMPEGGMEYFTKDGTVKLAKAGTWKAV